jgi:hypothetical protein
MSNIIKFPPNTRLTSPVSALQRFFSLSTISRVFSYLTWPVSIIYHSLVTHVAQDKKKRMQHVHRTGSSHAMKQGVSFLPSF